MGRSSRNNFHIVLALYVFGFALTSHISILLKGTLMHSTQDE